MLSGCLTVLVCVACTFLFFVGMALERFLKGRAELARAHARQANAAAADQESKNARCRALHGGLPESMLPSSFPKV